MSRRRTQDGVQDVTVGSGLSRVGSVVDIGALVSARRALELADSLPDVAKLIDGAELAREYCIRADASEAAQRDWATYSLRAQRKAGEILAAMPKAPAGRPSLIGSTVAPIPTLKDVLATKTASEAKHKSKRWQDVAAIPEAAFESYVDTAAEVSRSRLLRIGRDLEAETKRRERAAEVVENVDADAPRMDLRLGDFRTVLADIPDGSIDAIITDPPYPKEYLPLLADLAAFADRVLTPDGVLAVLFGQTWLPEVYRLLGGGRPYRWTAAYLTPGAGYVSMGRRVQSNWKPILIYGSPRGERFADVVRTDRDDKTLHHWQQDYSAFATLVERLTVNGQTVCDPFAGAGTTLLAARTLGRHAVGAEIDPEAFEMAMGRVK